MGDAVSRVTTNAPWIAKTIHAGEKNLSGAIGDLATERPRTEAAVCSRTPSWRFLNLARHRAKSPRLANRASFQRAASRLLSEQRPRKVHAFAWADEIPRQAHALSEARNPRKPPVPTLSAASAASSATDRRRSAARLHAAPRRAPRATSNSPRDQPRSERAPGRRS
jgi:hypothetical protein